MATNVYLAVDLGASSGRVLAGAFDGGRFELSEIHRFPNGPTTLGCHLYWNVLNLWANIQDGLKSARAEFGDAIKSVGVDTWGVDFALLGRNDELLSNPLCYRDPQNHGMPEYAAGIVSHDEIFAETGLQFMQINTLYQLLALRKSNSSLLDAAETFLMIPDLIHFLLTGEKASEFTDATTTQFLNPSTKDWSRSLLNRFEIPTDMLQSIAFPGTHLGKVCSTVADNTGLHGVEVVLPGTHDTASAVVAVPAVGAVSDSPNWAYISSGTWSLMGVEVASPIINQQCREFNFTNEGGVGGSIRLLKNITGLWLVQECQRVWENEGNEYDWQQLTKLASDAAPLQSIMIPDDPRFVAPAHMPNEIRAFCSETGQAIPESPGQVVRCALESLALRYRQVLEMLEALTSSSIEVIHIVGGGTQNEQLCQMTADSCQCPVIAGPIEATAIGNVVMQAIASGEIDSVESGRAIVQHSFPVQRYEPSDAVQCWQEAYARFTSLQNR